MNQQFGLLINDDGSARVWIGDEMTTIDPVQWLNLCCTCAEYLGFEMKQINNKRSELDYELDTKEDKPNEQDT